MERDDVKPLERVFLILLKKLKMEKLDDKLLEII